MLMEMSNIIAMLLQVQAVEFPLIVNVYNPCV